MGQPALANDYNGNCANYPNLSGGGTFDGNGNVTITDTNCTLNQAITATGIVSIEASTVTTQGITGNQIDINATTGNSTTTGNLSSSYGYIRVRGNNVKVTGTVAVSDAGNILLLAKTKLQTGAITGAPGYNVDLKANTNGGNTLFTIGGSGLTNGVNGTVTAKPLGNNPYYASTVLYITNGSSASTGGIKLSAAGNVLVTPSTGSRAGYVFLNAQNGILTMPAGIVSADGGASNGAGVIALLAKTIAFGTNGGVSANQASGVAGTLHGVLVSAETVTYKGSNGLSLSANGDGADAFNIGYVRTYPKGSVVISDTLDPVNLSIDGTVTPLAGNITYQGTGAAPLKMIADGSHTRVIVSGAILSFSSGAVTMQARGITDHQVQIENPGILSGSTTGLTFGGTGIVKIDVSAVGTGSSGGTVNINVDKATFNAPQLTVNANGPATSNGDGGTVYINSKAWTQNSTSKETITANGATLGIGNGGSISYFPGTQAVKLGTSAGDLQTIANGGGTGGNGGTININPNPGPTANITINTANAVSAVGQVATNGDGGSVTLIANPNISVTSTLTGAAITVDGNGTGKGGTIKILANGTLSLGTEAGGLSLSAQAKGTGNGGSIEIGYVTDLTVSQTGIVTVNGGPNSGSNGTGGVINFHNLGKLTVSGSLTADSIGPGKAGSITLSQGGFSAMTLTNAIISASGGCVGVNDCGSINITSPAKILADNTLFDVNGKSADGGHISIIGNSDLIDLTNSNLVASATESAGAGGFITINNNAQTIIDGALIHADGLDTGTGGQILITTGSAQPLSVSANDTRITASGGTNGDGGKVTIPYLEKLGSSTLNFFYVNTFIVASAGESVSGTNRVGGAVILNNIACKKIFTGYSWPTAYWNCVNPPTGTDGLPAQFAQTLIPSSVQALLTTNSAILYVFKNNADLTSFFNSHLLDPASGLTFDEGVQLPKISINVGVLENTVFPGTGNGPLNNKQLTEVTSHELGHAVDFAQGAGSYTTALIKDRIFLDSAGQPCQTGSAGPFNGLVDYQTNLQFCSNGGVGNVLNNPNGIYTGKTNSQIATISQPGILDLDNETFAQAFAYQDYVKTLSSIDQTGFFLTSVANGLFKKGYYDCTQVIGAQAAGKAYNRSHTYSCN